MRKFVSVSLAAMLFTSSAFAANQSFFREDVRPGPYMVYGVTADAEKNDNPACYAEVTWRDGSKFQVIRDLADGELYIFMQNMTWNISDPSGVYRLRANFKRGSQVTGLNFDYRLVNKNTIVIRNIIKEQFLPLFTGNQTMTFVMPGSIQNAEVDLTGSSKTMAEVSRCIDVARGVDLYPEGGAPAAGGTSRPRTFDNI
jgi:hypothetical protein